MRLHVEVTQEDIDSRKAVLAAKLSMYQHCMIAQAFNRATEGAFAPVHVAPLVRYGGYGYPDGYRWFIGLDGGANVDLPDDAGDRAADWECGRPVQPFSFDLDLPIEASR